MEEEQVQEVTAKWMGMRSSDSVAALSDALAKASEQFGEVVKSTKNPFYKSTYADLSALINATRPALSKHGLVVIQSPKMAGNGVQGVTVTTMLCHASGEWMSDDLTLPVAKYDPQGYGSAMTYARRYAYQSMLNLAGELDDDANAAVGKRTEEVVEKIASHESAFDQRSEGEQTLANFQMKGLQDLCQQHGKTEDQLAEFLKTLGVTRIEKALKRDFDKLKKWAVAPLGDLTEKLTQSVEIAKGNALYPAQNDWARLYASAGERGIQQSEIKQYYTRKYKIISGKELTIKQFKEVEAEVATWKGPSITAEPA